MPEEARSAERRSELASGLTALLGAEFQLRARSTLESEHLVSDTKISEASVA